MTPPTIPGVISHRCRWRPVLVCLVCLVLSAVPAFSNRAEAAPGAASDKIRMFYAALVSVMQAGSQLGPQGRYDRLKPVIGGTFDLPFMARAVVGPAWSSTPGSEQQDMTNAFWRFVTATYAKQFDSYAGQQFQTRGEQPYGAGVIVDTRIVKADGKEVVLKYLMRPDGADWRIGDIFLDGTVSELAVRRSEFSALVRARGVAGLTAALNGKAEALVGVGGKLP